LKGKVEEIQTKRGKKGKHSVSLIITIKKGLTPERSEQLLAEYRDEYMGKIVEITLPDESYSNPP